jgi:hypothetical protein
VKYLHHIKRLHSDKSLEDNRVKEFSMLSRLLLSLVFLAFIAAIGGFAVLAAWDVPVRQTQIEKTLDNSLFLQKS